MRPGPKDAFLWDDELHGFGLKVTPSGAKSFIFQYRLGGRGAKTMRWTIGKLGSPWTPASARDEADRLSKLVSQGIDPVEDKHRRARQAATLGFSSYVDIFTDGYLKTEWGDSWPQAKRQLEMHVVPYLKDAPLPNIKVSDLNPVLDVLRDRPALQKNVHAVMRKLFNWAEKRDDIEKSPMAKMDVPPGVKRSEEHTSELQSLMRISYAVFCLKQKTTNKTGSKDATDDITNE